MTSVDDPSVFSIYSADPGPQFPAGTRVNLRTGERANGIDVVPDPNGSHVVVSCEPWAIRVKPAI
jgi:hypothetical protein